MKKRLAVMLSAALLMGSGLAVDNAAAKKTSLQVKGSDTIVHMATEWAEIFMQENKSADIAVTGGGSGTGIAALLNGTADIANASRKIKAKELKLAKKKGLDIKEHTVARDGIAVIVNPKNPVSDLSLEQLKKIYVGAYTNWKKVGGPNKKIVLTGRNTASGTYAFFNKKVCEKEDYSDRMMNLASNSAIIQTITQDKWAIGYVGLGYLAKNKDKVKGLKVEGVAPSQKTVVDNSYVINRPLYLYTVGKPKGTAKKYLDLILSETGQQVVTQAGFVAVK
jgi:phosphate transport system substrate-binding protein